jgi:prephenate dehydrogenase
MVRRLQAVRVSLASGDDAAIAAWNDAAREDRRRLLESDLAGGEVHELRVLVPNRPGIVAEIALTLGRATIDIVDMGLYPSTGSHGTVALWIREAAVADAERLVRELGLEVARA